MDYYRKLRDLKTNKGPRKHLQLSKTQEEISPQSEGVSRGRRVRRRVGASRESTPMKQQQQQQPEQQKSGATLSIFNIEESPKQIETEMSPLRIPYNERSFESAMNKTDEKITGTGIFKREKRLFLTSLAGMTHYLKNGGMYQEEKLSTLFSIKGAAMMKRSKTRGSDILSLHMEESQTNMTVSSPLKKIAENKDDKEAWMEKVRAIKQGVNNYLGQDKRYIIVLRE